MSEKNSFSSDGTVTSEMSAVVTGALPAALSRGFPLIYLAGGMNSDWQDKVIAALPTASFRDPRKHGLSDEKEYTEWDLKGIMDCQIVLAYMDSANPSGFGLSLEVGYARALRRTIFYVCEDTTERQKYFGMMRACATRCFDSLDAAIEAMRNE